MSYYFQPIPSLKNYGRVLYPGRTYTFDQLRKLCTSREVLVGYYRKGLEEIAPALLSSSEFEVLSELYCNGTFRSVTYYAVPDHYFNLVKPKLQSLRRKWFW